MRSIHLRLTPEPLAPRVARRALRQLGDAVPPERLADAGLLVSELVTNSVRYAGPSGIDMRVDLDGTGMRIEVCDEGPGIPGGRAHGTMPAPAVGRGRGLALVASVAESWGIAPGPGARVWFTLSWSAGAPGAEVPRPGDAGPPARP